MLYDTHCHLDYYLESSENENLTQEEIAILEKIIEDCNLSDVKFLNTICVEIDKFKKIQNIANIFPNVYCSIGQHPLYVFQNKIEDFCKKIENFIKENSLLKLNKIIAIGECGLDFFKIEQIIAKENLKLSVNEFKEMQVNFLETQIEIAKKYNLPCIIHTRDSENETYEIFKNSNYFSGVLHSFTGSKNFMKKMLDLGFYISFSGIVTFKNANLIQEALLYCPLDRLIIETDSPYLSPEPFRGKSNKPVNVKYVFEFIKNFLRKNDDLKNIILENSKKIFKVQ